MGFLKSLGLAALDTALTPVAVLKDVATMGGVNTDQDEPYTAQHARRISRELARAREELED